MFSAKLGSVVRTRWKNSMEASASLNVFFPYKQWVKLGSQLVQDAHQTDSYAKALKKIKFRTWTGQELGVQEMNWCKSKGLNDSWSLFPLFKGMYAIGIEHRIWCILSLRHPQPSFNLFWNLLVSFLYPEQSNVLFI